MQTTARRTREEREAAYNPGPPSTSRKKRAAIGHKGTPREHSERRPWLDVETRIKKHRARRRARRLIGARGVKTNPRRRRRAKR